MTTEIRGNTDNDLELVKNALHDYEMQHPNARISIYRRNPFSIRLRIIDPDFEGLRKFERHDLIWNILATLPEAVQGDFSMVTLLTPGEIQTSLANLEFENPSPPLCP